MQVKHYKQNYIFLKDKPNNLGFGSSSKDGKQKQESDESDSEEKVQNKRSKRRMKIVDDEEGYYTSNNLQY